MAQPKNGLGVVEVSITNRQWEQARQSDSGACLIADALKGQGFARPSVDMATIRFTDPKTATRYVFLTPTEAQYILLGFDQGWSQPYDRFQLTKPIKKYPVIKDRNNVQKRSERLAELEAKETRGEPMSRGEKMSLTKMRKNGALERPHTRGKSELDSKGTLVGGHPPKLTDPKLGPNPGLLRSSHRHYGVKLASPGQVFERAVEEAVEQRLAEQK
jgi:hypothetical protein